MEKIWNVHVKTPPIWQCNITQGYFLYLKITLFNLCITGFAQKFFNITLEKMGFLTELSALEMFIFCAFQWNCNSLMQHDIENLVCFPWFWWCCKNNFLSDYLKRLVLLYYIPLFYNDQQIWHVCDFKYIQANYLIYHRQTNETPK